MQPSLKVRFFMNEKQGEEKLLPHLFFEPSDSKGYRGAPVKGNRIKLKNEKILFFRRKYQISAGG